MPLKPGANARAFRPSLEIATLTPKASSVEPPALLNFAVGVEVVAQAASPELWNTSAEPVFESVPAAPRSATVPSPESARALPRESPWLLLESDRIAVGVGLDVQEAGL